MDALVEPLFCDLDVEVAIKSRARSRGHLLLKLRVGDDLREGFGVSDAVALRDDYAHVVGYVGAVSDKDLERIEAPEALLRLPRFQIGKIGLEARREDLLRGTAGSRRVEVNAAGRIMRELDRQEGQPGADIQITLDNELQGYTHARLKGESAAAVVLDCESGDVLVSASSPSYDPNLFVRGISVANYRALLENPYRPLPNKAVQGIYPPGSTFKMVTALAALEDGQIDINETVYCPGHKEISGRRFHCWKRGGHGTVNMAKGIYQSCDVYYYHFAQRIGMDPIAAMAQRCGMGQEFPLPVASQFYGTVPYPAWKEEKYGRPWQAFDTVNATIGQGYMLANPLQLAVMSARLATGRHVQPRLVTSTPVKGFDEVDFAPEHVAYVRQAMSDVVNGPGTAGRARLPFDDIKMAGKTGTAQVVGLNLSDGKSGPWKYRDHGLFIFFAPFDKPKYAGAVVIEHGGGSGSAYPIARDVMTFLFDPEKGMEMLRGFEEQWGGTAQQRLDAKYRAYAAAAGEDVKPVPARDEEIFDQVEAEARLAVRRQESLADEKVDPRLDTSLSSGQASE